MKKKNLSFVAVIMAASLGVVSARAQNSAATTQQQAQIPAGFIAGASVIFQSAGGAQGPYAVANGQGTLQGAGGDVHNVPVASVTLMEAGKTYPDTTYPNGRGVNDGNPHPAGIFRVDGQGNVVAPEQDQQAVLPGLGFRIDYIGGGRAGDDGMLSKTPSTASAASSPKDNGPWRLVELNPNKPSASSRAIRSSTCSKTKTDFDGSGTASNNGQLCPLTGWVENSARNSA